MRGVVLSIRRNQVHYLSCFGLLGNVYESLYIRWVIYQKACRVVAPVDSALIPKRTATQFAIVTPVHSRLTPTQLFQRKIAHLMIADFE
jgi:hypothetical protein